MPAFHRNNHYKYVVAAHNLLASKYQIAEIQFCSEYITIEFVNCQLTNELIFIDILHIRFLVHFLKFTTIIIHYMYIKMCFYGTALSL